MTSFFGIKVCGFLRFSRKPQNGSAPTFFQNLGENTCSLQTALNNTAPGLYLDKIQN